MTYYVSEEVPIAWNHIITSFITCVEYDVEHFNGTPIEEVEFRVRRGLLAITYSGGDRVTDGYAFLAKQISAATCSECSLPSTRTVFGSPKCDNCY